MSFQFFDFLDLPNPPGGPSQPAGLFPGWVPPQPGETKAKAAAAKAAAAHAKLHQTLVADFRRLADSNRNKADELYRRASTADRRTAKKVAFLLPKIKEARECESLHGLYHALAEGLARHTLPQCLHGIKSASTLDYIRLWDKWPVREFVAKRLTSEGVNQLNFYQARDFVTAKCAPAPDRDMNRYRVLEMELKLVGTPLGSFFPTPVSIAREMARLAQLEAGLRVLEPSAGSGRIADALLERGRELGIDFTLDVIEQNWDLKELLAAKGYAVQHRDFLAWQGSYDRVILNPPFEKLSDVQHIQHAYSLLVPGGRLVGIMGDSAFVGSTAKAVAFRDWLHNVNAEWWQLPAGTFNEGDRPTKVGTRMVVIDKRCPL
ncbi:MAG: class I SAM-dependent methyltransferase [Blastocatellia bacterium]|nr:class I SAM-dependent methyltransferase [Blastocatellia bacterium]